MAAPPSFASGLAHEVSGHGEPILLLHGLGGRRRVWQEIEPTLAHKHQVITVDLPGFGESPPLADARAPIIPAQADAIELLLDELVIGRTYIVGNSLGGWLAFELARRGRARGVIAISPAGVWTLLEARWFWAVMTAHRIGAKLGRPFARILMRTGALRTLLFALIHSRGSRIAPEDGAETLRNFADAEGFVPTRRWCGSRQIEGLEEIDCPVLIAWGTRSASASAPGAATRAEDRHGATRRTARRRARADERRSGVGRRIDP